MNSMPPLPRFHGFWIKQMSFIRAVCSIALMFNSFSKYRTLDVEVLKTCSTHCYKFRIQHHTLRFVYAKPIPKIPDFKCWLRGRRVSMFFAAAIETRHKTRIIHLCFDCVGLCVFIGYPIFVIIFKILDLKCRGLISCSRWITPSSRIPMNFKTNLIRFVYVSTPLFDIV